MRRIMLALCATLTVTVPVVTAGVAGAAVSAAAATLNFGEQRVATYGDVLWTTVTFSESTTVQDVYITGTNVEDFWLTDPPRASTPPQCDVGVTYGAGTSCLVDVFFWPVDDGVRNGQLVVETSTGDVAVGLTGVGTLGYYLAGLSGQVAAFGDATDFGDAVELDLNAPIVDIATTDNGEGYWLLGLDGGVFSFGNAAFFGSTGGMRLNAPVIGIAPKPGGGGYWLVAIDGGVFAFGDAMFYGSMGGTPLNRPIVGMAPTPTGLGYWLVASDGGIFAFGDAVFHGSTGSFTLNQPIMGMAPFVNGGYWLVARDGGVFAFDAPFHGSTGSMKLAQPIVGLAATPNGDGYWFTAADGGVFAFGGAPFLGGLPGAGIVTREVIGIAATAPAVDPSQFDVGAAATGRPATNRGEAAPSRYLG